MAYRIFRSEQRREVKGVLFDMDGVILDSEKLYTRFWQEAANALGYPMTPEQALGMRSRNREAGIAQIQSYFGPQADYNAIRNERIRMMDAFVDNNGIALKPGIRELLDALDARDIPTAIATSSPMERVEEYLTPHGLLSRFTKIITGYEVPKGKPEPDIYLTAAARLGLPPQHCIALEDSAAGIRSAHSAGCMAVLVPDQDTPDEDTLARVYALADSLSDVIALL